MEQLTVTITKEDFANAPMFDSPEKCPLANALNRQFKEMGNWRVGTSTTTVRVYNSWKNYYIPENWGDRYSRENPYHPDKINDLIKLAQEGKDIPSVTMHLEETSPGWVKY